MVKLKQFVGCCLSVFDDFVGLALKSFIFALFESYKESARKCLGSNM